MHDCFSELKEKKMIISGVNESPGEDITAVTLGCLNKVIGAAMERLKSSGSSSEGLKKLHQNSIDKPFRVGKIGRNPRRNISVSFMRVADKEMTFKAKSETNEEDGIKFFLNDDVAADSRTLKAKLRRIVTVAKTQGIFAKLAGNKVVVGSRTFAANELSMIPSDIRDKLKQEKEIDDGIVFRGELSILSNFHPAPFKLDDIGFAHVEQYFQYTKATHHNEIEVAERIMNLSDPLRIKILGDSIEANNSWTERRMLVLYDGIRGKFEQNLHLQNELLATEGKHLYEATTDNYYGCGIGYDSNRWLKKDWAGENVTGLLLKKVRDELLGLDQEEVSTDNTLAEIASQEDICSSSEMEINEYTTGKEDNSGIKKPEPTSHSQMETRSASRDSKKHSTGNTGQPTKSSQSQSQTQEPTTGSKGYGRGKSRGRGKGRGRGSRGNYHNNQSTNRSRNSMSTADRNFLGIKDKKKPKGKSETCSKAPIGTSTPIVGQRWQALTEEQKKGLALLGLTPDLQPI